MTPLAVSKARPPTVPAASYTLVCGPIPDLQIMSCPHPVSISHLRLLLVLTGAAGGPLLTRLAAHLRLRLGTSDDLASSPAVRLETISGSQPVRTDIGTRTDDTPAVRLASTPEGGRFVMTQGMAFDFLFAVDGRVELAASLHTAGSWEYRHHAFSKH